MLAPWNFNCPAIFMALGIPGGRSGENLCHEGKSIPPGVYHFFRSSINLQIGWSFFTFDFGP